MHYFYGNFEQHIIVAHAHWLTNGIVEAPASNQQPGIASFKFSLRGAIKGLFQTCTFHTVDWHADFLFHFSW